MTADLTFLVAGLALLLAVVLPELVSRWALSAPIVLVAVGLLLGLTPLPDEMPLDPQENRAVIEHVTELTVIVALMGVGLALDRPLCLRDGSTWTAWSPTWRLFAVAMPLCVAPSPYSAGPSVWPRPRPCCSGRCSRPPTRCSPPTSRSPARPQATTPPRRTTTSASP